MRHASEGELHAYLDGALDLVAGAEASEVREHLAVCDDCARRLLEEREIREAAGELLARADPGEIAVPPLEELRERALAVPVTDVASDAASRPWWRWRASYQPLAWAATVVIALGMGWQMGVRFPGEDPGRSSVPASTEGVRAAPEVPAGDETAEATAESGRGDEAGTAPAELAELQSASLSPGAEIEASGGGRMAWMDEATTPDPGREKLGEGPGASEVLGGVAAPAEPEVTDLAAEMEGVVIPPQAVIDALADSLVAQRREEEERAAVTLDVPVVDVRGQTDRRGDTQAAAIRAAAMIEASPTELARMRTEPSVPAADEERVFPEAMGSSLAVPGLRVLTVEWEEWIPGQEGLRIRQLLPTGDTLELRFLGMLSGEMAGGAPVNLPTERGGEAAKAMPDPPPPMEASLPLGWNQVTVRWRNGWLVARAPLSKSSLMALIRTIS